MPPYAANWAFFLDIDGTLLDIEGHPDDVHIGRAELDLVSGLHRATGGALALVSGRPLAGIDVMFHPLKLPSAGQHGAERRDGSGKRHRTSQPAQPGLRRRHARRISKPRALQGPWSGSRRGRGAKGNAGTFMAAGLTPARARRGTEQEIGSHRSGAAWRTWPT